MGQSRFLSIRRELYPVLPDLDCFLSTVSAARKTGLSKAEIGDLTGGVQLVHHQDSFPHYCWVWSTIKLKRGEVNGHFAQKNPGDSIGNRKLWENGGKRGRFLRRFPQCAYGGGGKTVIQ